MAWLRVLRLGADACGGTSVRATANLSVCVCVGCVEGSGDVEVEAVCGERAVLDVNARADDAFEVRFLRCSHRAAG